MLGWGKIKHNKISDNFTLCRRMLFLSLEEMKRLFYDQFVQSLTQNELDGILLEHKDEFLPSVFARKYLTYLYA